MRWAPLGSLTPQCRCRSAGVGFWISSAHTRFATADSAAAAAQGEDRSTSSLVLAPACLHIQNFALFKQSPCLMCRMAALLFLDGTCSQWGQSSFHNHCGVYQPTNCLAHSPFLLRDRDCPSCRRDQSRHDEAHFSLLLLFLLLIKGQSNPHKCCRPRRALVRH